MSYYKNKKIFNYIYFLLIIVYVNGKIYRDNNKLIAMNLNEINLNTDCHSLNSVKSNIINFSLKDYDTTDLDLGNNIINYSDKTNYYFLNLSYDSIVGKELLLYTNLTNDLFFSENNNELKLSTFEKYSNEFILNHEYLTFIMHPKNGAGQGFIDFFLVNEGEFQVNQNILREKFYNQNITLLNRVNRIQYYINLIPTDNNSDLYYLQFSYSSTDSSEKEKIKLYYINNISNNTIKDTIDYLKKKQMKRDKKINGKIEILAIEYNDLKEDINLTLKYNRIKGDWIAGFILTLSVLFIILIIIVFIFLKNAYFGNVKNSSDTEEEMGE